MHIRLFNIVAITAITVLAVASLCSAGPFNLSNKDVEKNSPEVDNHEGWFWYEDPPEPAEETQEEEARLDVPKPFIPSMEDYTEEELWDMHPTEFQPLMDAFRQKAVQKPSYENVLEYLTVQDIARRKALEYAYVASLVNQKHPELSLDDDYPTATPGRNATYTARLYEMEEKIRSGQKEFALIYFYSPTCPYCTAQSSILEYFEDKYHWEIKHIDRDKKPNIAARFNVETVPFLMLIYRKSEDFFPVSVGVVSLTDLEERLYRGMRLLSGEITPQEWALFEFQRGGGFDPQSPKAKR